MGGWQVWIKKLEKYNEEHGNTNVPRNYNIDPGLAKFVQRQRKQYDLMMKGNRSKMTNDRVLKLESLGFDWAVTSRKQCSRWENMLEKLKQYKNHYGGFNIPESYDVHLFNWTRRQAHQFNRKQRGLNSNLTDEKMSKLHELGLDWNAACMNQSSPCEIMFEKLKKYKNHYGDFNLHESHDVRLFTWTRRQARQYNLKQKGMNSNLTDEKMSKLQALGLDFEKMDVSSSTKKGSNWHEMFLELKKYKDENNDCNVPQSYKLNSKLFHWTVRQKRHYMLKQRGKPSILTDARIFKLKELGFDFEKELSNNNKSNWNNMLEMLKNIRTSTAIVMCRH